MNDETVNLTDSNRVEENKEHCKIYTEREASELLRISTVTLWRERKKRKISFRRIAGKIVYLSQDIDEYLESIKRPASVK